MPALTTRRVVLATLTTALLLSTSCQTPANQALVQAKELGVKELPAQHSAFAIALHRELAAQPGNVFFSPYSVTSALSMTMQGARGATAAQMSETLGLPNSEATHASLGLLQRSFQTPTPGVSLSVANRLWLAKALTLTPAFVSKTKQHYAASAGHVDFAKAAAARQEINGWIAAQTKQRIKTLLPEGAVGPATQLVLTNAVHFKGAWAERFEQSASYDGTFAVAKDREVKARMMVRDAKTRFTSDGLAKVVRLPYRGDRLEMMIILPTKRHDLASVEAALTPEKLQGWVAASEEPGKLVFHMPRFSFSKRAALAAPLQKLGMKTPFTGGADFSGITTSAKLQIAEVHHEAFVAVDEEGTEAAAATAVVMTKSAAVPMSIRADEPFLFLIRDNASGAILFMGRVADPS